ncbi:MAG: fumarylacetoacetase [Flavobacteriales bacterium]
MLRANDPTIKTWVNVPDKTDFPIQNLPFGVIRFQDETHVASRIGDFVIDLAVLNKSGLLGVDYVQEIFEKDSINTLLSIGKDNLRRLRDRLSWLLDERHKDLSDDEDLVDRCLIEIEKVEVLMPVRVPNYTDFYSSIEHATNVGIMFRGKENALMPNWKHIPIGYHGRASSIVVSGTPIKRPSGQYKLPDQENPVFGPSRQLDFELEMAFITCKENELGTPVPIEEAEDYIWGMVIFNDWSARDIQAWEYQPLGPFLGKNFGSSISPWVIALDALEQFRVEGPKQEPAPLPYLQIHGFNNYHIELEVYIGNEQFEPVKISHSNHKYLYWNIFQQLAHHTVNGCNLQIGDMYASGTISGPIKDSFGSMLELSWRGTEPLTMPDGSERRFIENGDTVIMKAYAEKDGLRIGFGVVSAKVIA